MCLTKEQPSLFHYCLNATLLPPPPSPANTAVLAISLYSLSLSSLCVASKEDLYIQARTTKRLMLCIYKSSLQERLFYAGWVGGGWGVGGVNLIPA